MSAIAINDLSKTYPVQFPRLRALFRRPAKEPVTALKNVSFTISQGEIFGLIGRNGAGKTTLTKIVATLVQPTSGNVSVGGFDTVSADDKVRERIGLAGAEERSFYWRLTSEQNLLFFARLNGLSDRQANQRISDLFEMLELREAARRRFGELSTGNKQRLAVARALLNDPPILLLDEPTRSLDPLAAARMRELIKSFALKDPPVTILFTSHNLAEVETLCDRVAIISRGEIKAIDTPAHLRAVTSATERISIVVTNADQKTVERSLQTENSHVQIATSAEGIVAEFDREPGDETLDRILGLLRREGGKISDVEIKRATLLDVLEQYENPRSADYTSD